MNEWLGAIKTKMRPTKHSIDSSFLCPVHN